MLSWVFPFFTALLLIFFVFTIYNIPVVATGFWRLWRSRKKETSRIESGEQSLPFVSVIVPVKNEEKVVGCHV